MNGYHFSTDRRLPERDLFELADALALHLYETLGSRVYLLARADVAQLVEPFVDDLLVDDQQDVAWMVWHLFQEACEWELRG
ncbi:MAG: hypothetical protein N2378_10890 [Chloroflexaceae bacterium]|nr:hypothetical protein [Chloroflexaceae bacterium]